VKAFQIVAPRETSLRDVPVPSPGPSDVLLEVAAAGVCHSDLHLAHARALPYELPLTLGHELAGRIVEVGSSVTGRAVGESVLVYLCWGCGECRACLGGAENYCLAHHDDSVPGPGMGHHGGMADYAVVPARHVLPLGDLDPVTAAPLADAALTPYHAIDGARPRLGPGSTALVIGVGGLGNLAVQILAATTDARVIAVDTDRSRLELAAKHGAHETLVSSADTAAEVAGLTAGLGVDVVLDFVGAQPTLDLAADAVTTGGLISISGLAAGRLPLLAGPPPYGLPWGVSVVRPYAGSRTDLEAVLDLARDGVLEVPVEVHRLADAAAVLARLEAGLVQGRAVLVPDRS
jgi:propanol-preferring alcohol dehydrogenase